MMKRGPTEQTHGFCRQRSWIRRTLAKTALPLCLLAAVLLAPPCLIAAWGQQNTLTLLLRDERLSAPITVSLPAQPVDEVLRRLSGSSPSRLQANRPLAWERVSLFARDIPLQQILLGLSDLLNAEWESQGDGEQPQRQVLVQSVRARRYEERLWRDTRERASQPLFALAHYTRTPAQQWAKREKSLGETEPDDPLLSYTNLKSLAQPSSHAALQLLTTLSLAQRQTLLEYGRLFLRWRAMSPRQRELTAAMVGDPQGSNNAYRYGDRLPGEVAQKNAEESLAWLEQFGLVLYAGMDPATGAVVSYGIDLGSAQFPYAFFGHALFEPSLLPVRGRPYPPPPDAVPAVYDDLERMPFPPKFRLSTDRAYAWSEVVEQLSQHLPMPLFSDDFTGTRDPRSRIELPDLARLNLAEALDALCKAHGRLWWREGDALFFRSRTWFVERRYEVPPPTLALLSERLGKEHRLDTVVVAALSRLTLQQLQGLAGAANFQLDRGHARLRGSVFFQAQRAFLFLQFYSTLSASQQRQVLSSQGLTWERMPLSQQHAFFDLAAISQGRRVLKERDRLSFRIPQEKPYPAKKADAAWMLPIVFAYTSDGKAVAGLLVSYRSQEKHRGANGSDSSR